MTDILIRMEMPKTCFMCPLSFMKGERLFCKFTKEEVLRGKIAPECPLHELPEHGDLIDRSKLSFVCGGTAPAEMDYVRRYVVDGMPVIIPANKEETE